MGFEIQHLLWIWHVIPHRIDLRFRWALHKLQFPCILLIHFFFSCFSSSCGPSSLVKPLSGCTFPPCWVRSLPVCSWGHTARAWWCQQTRSTPSPELAPSFFCLRLGWKLSPKT